MMTGPAEGSLASRFDAESDAYERIEFRGREGQRIFTCTYQPKRPARASVVICPPIYTEFTKNYRREVLLARRLARAGFAVGRFHYLGTGNSDGEGAAVTFQTMRDDALGCVEHLRALTENDLLVLVGTRWGGLIAASAATMYPGAPLVLWEPLLSASRYFKEAFRARIVFERKKGVERPTTGQELTQRLRDGQAVDIVGNTIEGNFFESSSGRTLQDELDASPRPVLILQIGPMKRLRPDLSEQADRWQAAGLAVDVDTIDGDETWWMVDERWPDETNRPMTRALIDRTVDWIDERMPRQMPREVG